MKFIELIGELVIIYVLYKVIFNFIIPAYQGVKHVKTKMNEMQQRMQEQQRAQSPQHADEAIKKTTTVAKDDYIDYEEVK